MRLGIDFGTYKSSAAFIDGSEMILIEDPASSNFLVPSSIFVTQDGKVFVGKSADKERQSDYSAYRNELKRYLGEPEPLLFGKHITYTPTQAIAKVVGKIKRDADAYVQHTGRSMFQGVVITIPATYENYKRDLMIEVAVEAGFARDTVDLLEEPVAACLSYSQKKLVQEGEIVLIYDLGGGTFDTAIMEKRSDNFLFYKNTLPRGIDPCGGIDFDYMIYLDFIAQHPQLQDLVRPERTDEEALFAQALIGETCIEMKHQLSGDEVAERIISVPGIAGLIRHRLTRPAFNQMIADTLHETIDCCRNMLESSRIQHTQISRILLVGGSCRIPYVRELLKQEFGCPITSADDLEAVVCKGAAVHAANLEKKAAPKTLLAKDKPAAVKDKPATAPTPEKQYQGKKYVVRDNPWDLN